VDADVSFTTLVPREVYRGEMLFCPQDGYGRIVRFSGAPAGVITAPAAAAGTVATIAGSNVILGTGTTFTTQAPVGSYIVIGGFPGRSWLVKATISNVQIVIDAPIPAAFGSVSGLAWGLAARFGHVGLCMELPSNGVATFTSASTTVTGYGSNWFATYPEGAPQPGVDHIGVRGNYDRVSAVANVTSSNLITLSAAAAATYTQQPYVLYRPAVGREVRYHGGRLYFTGVSWDDTGVYYTPVNAPLGLHQNTDQPSGTLNTNFAVSQCMLKFDVPIQGAVGKNMALLSTPQGLLILRTDGAYIMYGDPPTQQVQPLANGAGCVATRASCVGNRGEGAFWGGKSGIFRYIGGRVIDLTEGRRNREWRAIMDQFLENYRGGPGEGMCNLAVMDGHLFVSVYDFANVSNRYLWVYDLQSEAWCGNFSMTTLTHMSMYMSSLSNTPPNASTPGSPDDIYFAVASVTGNIASNQGGRMDAIVRDEGGLGSSNVGTFQAELPESVVGTPSDLSRVTEAKLVYELTGSGATMALESNVDGGAFGTDATLGVTAAGPQEQRVMPGSDVAAVPTGALGKLGRRHGHRITQTGSKPTALRVHEIDLVVRPRRPRA
jgi:hypothetical protein